MSPNKFPVSPSVAWSPDEKEWRSTYCGRWGIVPSAPSSWRTLAMGRGEEVAPDVKSILN